MPKQAILAGIPVIPGTDCPVASLEEVAEFAYTYIMTKAAVAVVAVGCV